MSPDVSAEWVYVDGIFTGLTSELEWLTDHGTRSVNCQLVLWYAIFLVDDGGPTKPKNQCCNPCLFPPIPIQHLPEGVIYKNIQGRHGCTLNLHWRTYNSICRL